MNLKPCCKRAATSADWLLPLLYEIPTLTMPPVPAVTVKVLGMASKRASKAVAASIDPVASSQTLLSVPIVQDSPGGSAQRAKV